MTFRSLSVRFLLFACVLAQIGCLQHYDDFAGSRDTTPEVPKTDVVVADLVVPPSEDMIDEPDSSEDPQDACVPDCTGKQCGDDSCGGICGECAVGNECEGHQCVKSTGSCISVSPKQVKFGGKKIGELVTLPLTISSCGDAPLEVYGIDFTPDSSADFGLDLTLLGHEPTEDEPLVLSIGDSATINVVFIPGQENPTDDNGNPIPDEGIIEIKNNTSSSVKEIDVNGFGAVVLCPTGVIQIAEGDEVIPQTVLHLYGDQSYAATGTIAKWAWSVEQPLGSQSVFIPSNSFPNPTFEGNVAGKYIFSLTVYDEQDVSSCAPDTFEVVMIPDEAIHIELLWHTPEDPDETDEGPDTGSDLDLHFTHPWAGGPDLDGDGEPDGWFDQPFDCFWFNAHPEWGDFDPSIDDNPGLDRDDTTGAGPENINLNLPEDVLYKVGVHYWNDHDYGTSYATVRVYIYSQLVFETPEVKLVDSDMWEVCTVEWPSAEVLLVTNTAGQHHVTPNYQNPFFLQD